MPALVPGYAYDVFISYRQKDNRSDHWVTQFVQALRDELDSMLKDEVTVYFDINPHDGLLETHDVDNSLKEKVKSLILLPIVSQTYCDLKAFAWKNEFLAFIDQARSDRLGMEIQLNDGNVAKRVLPVRIHDIDAKDKALFESAIGGVMRPVDFIYREPGVNRPLFAKDDEVKGTHTLIYRDQINKVALGIKALLDAINSTQSDVLQPPPVQKPAKSDRTTSSQPLRRLSGRWLRPATLLLVLLSVGYVGYDQYTSFIKKEDVRNRLIPELKKMVEGNTVQFPSGFTMTDSRAFFLAMEARDHVGDEPELKALWPFVARKMTIRTDPPGAQVSWCVYGESDAAFRSVGYTPLDSVSLPNDLVILRISKPGFNTVNLASWTERYYELALDSMERHLRMVQVPSGNSGMQILGLDHYAGAFVPAFRMDEFEVTNGEYKKFVEAGGYRELRYWKQLIQKDGKVLSLGDARKHFVDKTGLAGPAVWEAGTFPDGQEDYPVHGVSWYEAAAYAEFAGKRLPSVFHWSRNAITIFFQNRLIDRSNFDRSGAEPTGSMGGVNRWGCQDLAGNVREWCFNSIPESSSRYILGGGFNDPSFMYNESLSLPALDRSPGNGFRCMIPVNADTALENLDRPLQIVFRDYNKEYPADDATFRQLLAHYAYDPRPLKPSVTQVLDTTLFKVERIELDAAFGKERQIAYLYLPHGVPGPYQTILYWPGSNTINRAPYEPEVSLAFDFFLKTGRAVIYPILKGTFERSDGLLNSNQENTVRYKGYVVAWISEIHQLLDYLDTRPDMDKKGYGYFGYSWGGAMAPIALTTEPRFKAAVLHVGGLRMQSTLPEVDPINFAPHVKVPVLMLNGKNDMVFPYEISQKHLHRLLGTPDSLKQLMVFEGGHLVPKQEIIKESIRWFDRYLGR